MDATADELNQFTFDDSTGAFASNGPAIATRTDSNGLVVHPAAIYLYVSNPSDADISVTFITPGTGVLSYALDTANAGTSADGIAFSEDGEFAFVLQASDNLLQGYTYNSADGTLVTNGSPMSIAADAATISITPRGDFVIIGHDNAAGADSVSVLPINASGVPQTPQSANLVSEGVAEIISGIIIL